MTDQLISLRFISDNPYQPRTTDDPEHIEKLARSIAADGLLQKPTARHFGKNGSHQLAFGHSRRKAFEWLRDNWQAQGLTDRYNGYSVMPVLVADLTDEEMYRNAISENVQRKDLNPIELAQAMIKYRDEFKKSSEEVGQLFGMNGATVRGLVRLLELPEAVKDQVASGAITQGAARKLLTIARVDEGSVKEAAQDIVAGENPDDVIEESMRNSDRAVTMWERWNDGEPRGGKGLWLLRTDKFPMKQLPELKATDVANALEIELTVESRVKIDGYLFSISQHPDLDTATLIEKQPADADLIERIVHLLNPPVCASCPFHTVIGKTHYCSFKSCHQRKTKAWVAAEMAKVSKKLGIPVYDPTTDGKACLPLCEHTYQGDYAKHAKLVKDQDPDLRLQPNKDDYNTHKWTDSHFVRLILVGKKAEAVKEKKQADASTQAEKEEARQQQYALERARRDASVKFYNEHVLSLFAPAFKKLDHVVAMCQLAGVGTPKKGAKKSAVLSDLHMRLADRALRGDVISWQVTEKGPVVVAKRVQKIAAQWGLKAPADFLTVAKGYEPAVAVETKGKK